MTPRSIILLALGALAVEANMLLPRAGKDGGLDDSVFSVCNTKAPAQTKSYEGCYTSAMLAVGACKGSPDACGCSLYTAIAKTCIPIVCPTALASSLLSVGCEALIGATATATGTGGGSVKPTSAAGTAKTGAASGGGSGTARTGTIGSVFSTAAPTGGAATTGGSSGTDNGSGSGSGSGSGGSSAGSNNNGGSPQTTSSRALAGEMAVPVVGGVIAGLVGALAVLL